MNEFEILRNRVLSCTTIDEWCLAQSRAGQLISQLIASGQLDIELEIEWEQESNDGVAFMIYCDRLEERYPNFPKNVEGIHPTMANGFDGSSMSWEQRKFTYADICDWLSKFFDEKSADTTDTKTDTKKKTGKKRQLSSAGGSCAIYVRDTLKADPTANRMQVVKDWAELKNGVWDGKKISVESIYRQLTDNPESWRTD